MSRLVTDNFLFTELCPLLFNVSCNRFFIASLLSGDRISSESAGWLGWGNVFLPKQVSPAKHSKMQK